MAFVCVSIIKALSPLLGVLCSASLFDPLISINDVTEIPVCGLLGGLNLVFEMICDSVAGGRRGRGCW